LSVCYPQFYAERGQNRHIFPTRLISPVCYIAQAMKVFEAFEPYINFCRVERQSEPSTIDKYRDCFRVWILPWLGNAEINALGRPDVLRLRQSMENRGLSVARQYSIITCLKGMLGFCRSTLGVQCLDRAQISLPKREVPNVEYLDNEEIQRFLDAIDVHTFTGIRLRAMSELLLATGMRISEGLALTRAPFETEQRDVDIVGKGKRRRTVFFSARCRHWIAAYLNRRTDDNPALFVTTGFPVRKFRREDAHRFFANLRARAGITKRLTPHILRHTFCTNLRNNGADISLIKDLAGHQNIQTTARYYLGKDKEVLRRAVDACLDYRTDRQDTNRGDGHQSRPTMDTASEQ
jgi:integrase/recombinase XerD